VDRSELDAFDGLAVAAELAVGVEFHRDAPLGRLFHIGLEDIFGCDVGGLCLRNHIRELDLVGVRRHGCSGREKSGDKQGRRQPFPQHVHTSLHHSAQALLLRPVPAKCAPHGGKRARTIPGALSPSLLRPGFGISSFNSPRFSAYRMQEMTEAELGFE
jgi:hypothetical protein